MKISYEKRGSGELVVAEGVTLDEVIANLKLTEKEVEQLRREMPENFTVHDVGLYLYINKFYHVFETLE